ncbi:MAG: arylsulfatase [Cyclobacteriaceae bacterium]|nr:arylsulfatase [Cyclobacteriaceae bacterium]
MKYSLFFIMLFTICACAKKTSDQRPNIIIVMVDDMGFSDIGCYGSEIATPHIDSLGYNGIRFTQFYNASRCCPTRASLLTGQYPHQAGMGDMVDTRGRSREPGPYQGWLSRNTVTIAEVLKRVGYNTYMSGKWHVGEDSLDWPLQRGFDKYFGLISGANSYFEILPNRKIVSQNTLLALLPDNFYMTHALTDSARKFVAQGLEQDKPFFLYLAYTAPHWPLHATHDKMEMYKGKYLEGWDSVRNRRHRKQIELGLFEKPVDLSPRDEVVPDWKVVDNKESWDLKMAAYAAMLSSVDEGIGRIVQLLRDAGQLDNTMIMFLSDNGACHETLTGRMDNDLKDFSAVAKTIPVGQKGSYVAYGKEWANACNTPFRLYKHWTHEGGINTPFIIHYPNVIRRGRIVHETAHLIDIMPTVLELSGGNYPKDFEGNQIHPVEGTSLVPLLNGIGWKGHEMLFWEHEKSKAVRKGKWKLVSEPDKPWELYDMHEDRSELHNVSLMYPDTVHVMEVAYNEWASRVGVKLR